VPVQLTGLEFGPGCDLGSHPESDPKSGEGVYPPTTPGRGMRDLRDLLPTVDAGENGDSGLESGHPLRTAAILYVVGVRVETTILP
jgi:hypothetical protein